MTIEQLYEIYLAHPSVVTDTRLLKGGDLFFALKGPNFNGNEFALRALEMGAAYAVIDEVVGAGSGVGTAGEGLSAAAGAAAASGLAGDAGTAGGSGLAAASGVAGGVGSAGAGLNAGTAGGAAADGRLIVVPDVLGTLQALALHHRQQFNIPFIAITGSNGKTTTKELVHAVLASTFTTYTTKGNLNNHIGIPLTILSVRPDAEFAVIEMGANHQKEIEGYCKYTLPTHGIITNIGKAHLEGFGGPEGVKKGKGELYDWLRDNSGTAFVLTDSADLKQMSRGIAHVITYGTREGDFVGVVAAGDAGAAGSTAGPGGVAAGPGAAGGGRAAGSTADGGGSFLIVEIKHGAAVGTIHTQLVGDYNLPNVLVAVTVGKHFGVEDAKILRSIEKYTPSNSRSQLIERDGNHIILDAYNANPSSMRAAIENFAKIPVNGANAGSGTAGNGAVENGVVKGSGFARKVLVLGAMAELGPESLNEHRGIVDLIAQYPWREVALVGGDFEKLDHPYRRFADNKAAAAWFAGAGFTGMYILIKGSRSSKMEAVLG